MDMIKDLEAVIEYKQKELEAMNPLLELAEKQAMTMDEHSSTVRLKNKIKEYVLGTIREIEGLKEEIETYKNIERPHPIEVMHFRAGYRNFQQDELKKIQTKLRVFSKMPYMLDINSGYSEEGILYASEDIDMDEAQAIWDYLERYSYNEDNMEDRWEWGDLILWDGKTAKKIKTS